jgi:hypothetical protein
MAKKKKTNAQILKNKKPFLKRKNELAAAEKQAEDLAAQKVTTVAAQKTSNRRFRIKRN